MTTVNKWTMSFCLCLLVVGCALTQTPPPPTVTVDNSYRAYVQMRNGVNSAILVDIISKSSSRVTSNACTSVDHAEFILDDYFMQLRQGGDAVRELRSLPSPLDLALFKQFYSQWLQEARELNVRRCRVSQSYSIAAGELVYRIVANEYRIAQR